MSRVGRCRRLRSVGGMFSPVAKPDNLIVSDQVLRRRNTMSAFQHIVAKAATMGAVGVLLTASFAAAEQGGRYWVPKATSPGPYWGPTMTTPVQGSEPPTTSSALYRGQITTNPAPYSGPTTTKRARHVARKSTKPIDTTHVRKRSPLAAMAQSVPDSKTHHLILQINTNDPATMNLALNNATNVTQHYKEVGEKVKIEVVTFGPGLHMLGDDTSPVKARIEQMALSTPEVSFKACGHTWEKMRDAEHKDVLIIPQAQVVNSGVVRVMELQEKGWSYLKP
jgi:uncharacterized protein